MRDKPDWADDAAKGLDGIAANFRRPEKTRANVAAALRKAKADGMREAADMMDAMPTLGLFLTGVEALRTRAAAIEAGED